MNAIPAPLIELCAISPLVYIVIIITINNEFSIISRNRMTKYLFSPFKKGVTDLENTHVSVPKVQRSIAYYPTISAINNGANIEK